MSPQLQNAIQNLYTGFADVKEPTRIEACPCCLSEDEIGILLSKSLRQITPRELSGYASSVFLTVGSEKDFRYFLPRILENLVSECSWWPDPEVVGRAVGTFSWDAFTPAQQALIVQFFDVVMHDLVSAEEVDGLAINSWLCCCSHFVPQWANYLSLVETTPPALKALYECHSKAFARGATGNGFWNDSPKKPEYLDWIRGLMEEDKIRSLYGLEKVSEAEKNGQGDSLL